MHAVLRMPTADLGLPDAAFMLFMLAWPAGPSSIRTSSYEVGSCELHPRLLASRA